MAGFCLWFFLMPEPQKLGDAINPVAVELSTVEDIDLAQKAYFAKTGEYLQVLKDSKLPFYEEGDVKSKLEADVAPEYVVNVYESDTGKGYQICTEDIDFKTCTGFGPQAKEYTYQIPKWQYDPRIASTTP